MNSPYPIQCYIEITDSCNLSCKHCFANAHQSKSNFLSLDDIKDIYQSIENLGVIYVNISGGEPLLHKDFFEIIEFAVSQPYRTCLLTNGILWDEHSIKKLSNIDKENKLVIQISMDGNADIVKLQRDMSNTEYERLLNNISLFRSYGFTVTSIHVANSITVDYSLDYIKELLENNVINSIKIVPMFSAGRAAENRKELDTFWDKWCNLVVAVNDIKKNKEWGELSSRLNIGYFTLYELVYPLHKAGLDDDIEEVWGINIKSKDNFKSQTRRPYFCEVGFSEIVLNSKNEMYPCVASISSKLICNEFSSIEDNWNNDSLIKWFRDGAGSVKEIEPCRSCNYVEICNGGCRLSAFEILNDINQPDPRCPFVKEYKEASHGC